MAQRDLTKEFFILREGFKARRGPRRHRNPYEKVGTVDDHVVKPSWVITTEEIKRNIKDIDERIKILNQLHKNRLLVRFDNSELSKDREIDAITNEITSKFREAEKLIKSQLFSSGHNNEFINKSSADYVVKENIKKQLASELQQKSIIFRKSQKEYMQRLRAQKGHVNGMDDILGLDMTNQKSSKAENSLDALLLDTMDADQSQMLERDREIQKIAENVNELATIFQDLATLVIDQGTILDRIDHNLENVQIRTEQGLKELMVADKYSENSRPFQCILVLVGIIVLESLILMAKAS